MLGPARASPLAVDEKRRRSERKETAPRWRLGTQRRERKKNSTCSLNHPSTRLWKYTSPSSFILLPCSSLLLYSTPFSIFLHLNKPLFSHFFFNLLFTPIYPDYCLLKTPLFFILSSFTTININTTTTTTTTTTNIIYIFINIIINLIIN